MFIFFIALLTLKYEILAMYITVLVNRASRLEENS